MSTRMRGTIVGEVLEYKRVLRDGKLGPRELAELQARKLRGVIRNAYEKVPYYRELFRSAGIAPGDVRTVADLEHVPVTTKQALRDAGVGNTIAAGIELTACLALRTNGTTGQPFTVYVPRDEARTRRLVELRGLRSIGFRPGDRLTILGPERPFRARLRHRLGLHRTETISAWLPIEEHIRRLRAFQPTILWTYPTLLRAILLQLDRLSEIVRPRVLITSAEMFSDVLRQRIEDDLPGIRIFNSYGAMEFGRIALECPTHEGLHVTADQVILECRRADSPAAEGEWGVAVLTHLYAYAMPLIRYRLGDMVSSIGERCSCGSSFPLVRAPLGRDNDMVRLPSGRVMSPIPLQYLVRGLGDVDQFRFIQEATDHIVLQLVTAVEPTVVALAELRSRILDCCREPLRVEIQLVDHLADEGPKFKSFLSRLPDHSSPRETPSHLFS